MLFSLIFPFRRASHGCWGCVWLPIRSCRYCCLTSYTFNATCFGAFQQGSVDEARHVRIVLGIVVVLLETVGAQPQETSRASQPQDVLFSFRADIMPGALFQPPAHLWIHRTVTALRNPSPPSFEIMQTTSGQFLVDHTGVKLQLVRTYTPATRTRLRNIAHKFFKHVSKRTPVL